jgi:hypothetical protein
MLEEARYDPIVRALDRVGRIYKGYHDTHTSGPGNWAEMRSFVEDDEGGLAAIKLVREQGFQMKWRLKYDEIGRENARKFILAESTQSDAKLMLNGKIAYYVN